MAQFANPGPFHAMIADSWRRRDPTLFGRFDFRRDSDGGPRMLECNADTRTALLEASVVQ